MDLNKNIPQEIVETREFNKPISPFLKARWSPRSMTGEVISEDELLNLFEAARWAPSSFNEQPWEIIYAKRDTPHWERLYALLVDKNQLWCKNASHLLVFVSSNVFKRNGNPSRTHSYDTGAAWMSLALEGASRGLVIHGMSGFDFEKAKTSLEIPDGYTVEAMAAIGKRAPKENLPEPLQKMEVPSQRKKVAEFIHEGKFTRG